MPECDKIKTSEESSMREKALERGSECWWKDREMQLTFYLVRKGFSDTKKEEA